MTKRNYYPYSRVEECSWQPEEVARNLAALASSSNNTDGTKTTTTTLLLHQ